MRSHGGPLASGGIYRRRDGATAELSGSQLGRGGRRGRLQSFGLLGQSVDKRAEPLSTCDATLAHRSVFVEQRPTMSELVRAAEICRCRLDLLEQFAKPVSRRSGLAGGEIDQLVIQPASQCAPAVFADRVCLVKSRLLSAL